jgi:hypothetical protein
MHQNQNQNQNYIKTKFQNHNFKNSFGFGACLHPIPHGIGIRGIGIVTSLIEKKNLSVKDLLDQLR